MIRVFNRRLNDWLTDVYIDEFENVYQYKKTAKNGNITLTPVNDDCLVLQNIGYADKNKNLLYEYDIISNEEIKQGVIICFECTYIVMDFSKDKYYMLSDLNPLTIERVDSALNVEVIDKDGNVVRFDFKEVNEDEQLSYEIQG